MGAGGGRARFFITLYLSLFLFVDGANEEEDSVVARVVVRKSLRCACVRELLCFFVRYSLNLNQTNHLSIDIHLSIHEDSDVQRRGSEAGKRGVQSCRRAVRSSRSGLELFGPTTIELSIQYIPKVHINI